MRITDEKPKGLGKIGGGRQQVEQQSPQPVCGCENLEFLPALIQSPSDLTID